MQRLSDNAQWGIKWGLYAAVFFSAWVSVVRVMSGAEAFIHAGLSFEQTVAAYFVFGVVGGVLLGVSRPLTRWWWGAGLVGWLLAALVYMGFATLTANPPWRWGGFIWAVLLLMSAIVGWTGGVTHWKRNSRRK